MFCVMAGLVGVPARKRAGRPVPAIHVFMVVKDVDARDKRGHDGGAGRQGCAFSCSV